MGISKFFGGKFFPLTFITIICLAVLWQCSGEPKTTGETMTEGSENTEAIIDDDTSIGDDVAVGANDLAAMDAIGDELTFTEGTWAWKLQDYLANGYGSQKFILDKLPAEEKEVSAVGKEQLDNLAVLLKAYPDLAVEVQGHSRVGDGPSDNTTNRASSKLRAVWVQNKLAARGVSVKQMSVKGLGGNEPMKGVDGKDISQRRITVMFTK